MTRFINVHKIAAAAAVSLALAGCVDNDYDLSKDIDMNVTVGGNITIPSSNTDFYRMSQILDLDENSTIKPDGELYGLSKGDYVLVQEGNTSPSTFNIAEVYINDIKANDSSIDLSFMGVGNTSAKLTAKVENLRNPIEFSDANINKEILSLDEANTDIDFTLRLGYATLNFYDGSVVINKDFTISFPDYWTVENRTAGDFTRLEGNTLRFTKDYTVNGTIDITVHISKFDLRNIGEGQGLYEPGHFNVATEIISNGNITITNGSLAAGQATGLRFSASPIVSAVRILSIVGKVNPEININATSFAIDGVPDFLKSPGNNLDIDNPRINLTIKNTSPVDVDVNAVLTGHYDNGKSDVTIGVGTKYGTSPITVAGNATTVICLSRLGTGGTDGALNVKVPNLGDIIATIPYNITMSDIDAKVNTAKSYRFDLGNTYDFTVDYRIVVPLAFGPDLKFTYNTSDKEWDEDLSDYNFREVHATLTVENSAPLNMVPTIRALDRYGNVMDNVTATIEGTIKAGSLTRPSSNELKIVLRSTGKNLDGLDGVDFEFTATAAPEFTGTPLNESQALKFNDIVLQLIGGIDIDLN